MIHKHLNYILEKNYKQIDEIDWLRMDKELINLVETNKTNANVIISKLMKSIVHKMQKRNNKKNM